MREFARGRVAPRGPGDGRPRGRAGGMADPLERPGARAGRRYDRALLWFVRAVALAWLLKAVLAWAQILGALPGLPAFEDQRLQHQAAITYFAVVDATAAVGLWLGGGWGGVIWLVAAVSYVVLGATIPALDAPPPLLAGAAALVLAYLVLSWLATRQAR